MAEDLKKCIKKCTLNDTKKNQRRKYHFVVNCSNQSCKKKIQIGKNETVAILILLIPESE